MQKICFRTANATTKSTKLNCIANLVCTFANTPIQEKTGSRMETRPKGPSIFASPGGKYKLDKQSLSKEFQNGATKY